MKNKNFCLFNATVYHGGKKNISRLAFKDILGF